MAKRSRRYRELIEQDAEPGGPMSLKDAVKKLKTFANTNFDQSVEIAMKLGVDPRQSDQLARGAVALPKGTGKARRVICIAQGENAEAAKAAGAEAVGAEDLVKKIQDGWLEFDLVVTSPDMMRLVGPLGRLLGPKGLMPSPKNGTVTQDVGQAVSDFKGGKVEYRTDSSGNVHAMVGKLSFSEADLEANILAFAHQIRSTRPAAVKGAYIRSVTISATMSPGVRVQYN